MLVIVEKIALPLLLTIAAWVIAILITERLKEFWTLRRDARRAISRRRLAGA